MVVPHNESARSLERCEVRARAGRWVVTESYFSMEGDVPSLRELRAICSEWDAALVLDEAHAIGVLGPKGPRSRGGPRGDARCTGGNAGQGARVTGCLRGRIAGSVPMALEPGALVRLFDRIQPDLGRHWARGGVRGKGG